MSHTKRPKTQTFKSPLVDKISHPVSYEIINCQGRQGFLSFNDAFIFRKTSRYCSMESVTVQFRPKPNDVSAVLDRFDNSEHKDERLNKYYAVYNNDQRYFTPAFLMGRDLRDYVEYPAYDHEKFKDKVKQSQQRNSEEDQNRQILVPKPSGHKCQICKQQFKDYEEHIKERQHLRRFRQSLGWKYSYEMVAQFQKNMWLQKKKQHFPEQNTNKVKKDTRRKTRVEDLVEQVRINKDKFKTKPIAKDNSKKTQTKAGRLNGASSTYVTVS